MQNWIIPLTLLPGIGLFILSTSNISINLGVEVGNLIDKGNASQNLIRRKINQLKRLHVALTMLYVSAICYAMAGMAGSIGKLTDDFSERVFVILIFMGVILLAIAIIILIIFAYKSIYNRQLQFEEKLGRG